jgi:GNAT superfamily N-acetyltransferase
MVYSNCATYPNYILPCQIRFAYQHEWEEAMDLVWKTFSIFEAPIYLPEGVKSFEKFINDKTLRQMFEKGEYQMLVATYEDKIVGIVTLRHRSHLSLLFVEEKYHFMGVGRALITHLCDYLRDEAGVRRVTVNASPYSLEFYHRIGFRDTGLETLKDGIRYTPMEINF